MRSRQSGHRSRWYALPTKGLTAQITETTYRLVESIFSETSKIHKTSSHSRFTSDCDKLVRHLWVVNN